jgi:DNA-binding MarR family transcriptional regulator
VQATSVKPKHLAQELHVLCAHLMRGSGPAIIALLEELDLSMTHVKALHLLDGCAGGQELTVKDLGERLGLSLPGASRTVDGLLRRGLLERREDEHDRRMKRVRISADGRGVIERINSARLAGLESWAKALPPTSRDRLHEALVPILDDLRDGT